LKEEALDRTLWGTGFGRGYGPVVRQTTDCCLIVTKSKHVARGNLTSCLSVKDRV